MADQDREKCELHGANGLEEWCTRESCIFWRLLEAQKEQEEQVSNKDGCGLQHFNLIEGLDPGMAEWLLDMKLKLEGTNPDAAIARITFRRREQ